MGDRIVVNNGLGGVHLVLATLTAMVGYTIHGSFGWAVIDWLFYPIAVIKWLICQEITLDVIHRTFPWFFG